MAKTGSASRKNKRANDDSMVVIDTALTILEKLPQRDEDIYPLLVETEINQGVYPMKMFQRLFEKLQGKDAIPKVVSYLIGAVLGPLEVAVKGVLLTNLQNIIQDCSINLWISDDLIKNGIVFDIKHIDMFDTLEQSPLAPKGKYLYTDCEGIKTIDGLKEATDFNALLYYVKQRNANRVVWADPSGIDTSKSSLERQLERNSKAILTLDFVERPSALKDNVGARRESNNATTIDSVPYNNCLQLFIGNALLGGDSTGNVNRYSGKTVMAFNTDYIKSIKLFDKKVVTAQLIANLSGLGVELDASFKAQLLNEEIDSLITQVIHNDNVAVSDCFFTFSNEEYDALMQKAEMKHLRGMPFGGEYEANVKSRTLEELNAMLDQLSPDATQEEIKTFIEGGQYKIEALRYDGSALSLSGDVTIDGDAMLETFLDNLAKIIIRSVLTPKVYLLILTNRALMGDVEDFRIEEFLAKCKNLLLNIITQINDIILEALMNLLIENLKPLASRLLQKIGLEQMQYYQDLLMKMIACIKRKHQNEEFDIANVQYADIYNNGVQPTDVEC